MPKIPGSEILKNSRILAIQTSRQQLQDACKILQPRCLDLLSVASAQEIPNLDFDLILVEYAVADMTSVLIYKNLVASLPQQSPWGLAPAIFIADTRTYDHRLNAFEIGAADFIARPLEERDLLKKCGMHIKNRRRFSEDQCVHIGNLSLNPLTQTVKVEQNIVNLTQLEYKILHFLVMSPRPVVTRTEIYEHVWGSPMTSTGRLDTQLYNLKKKIAKFNGKIKSVNKVGMRILMAESTFSQEAKKADPPPPSPGPRP